MYPASGKSSISLSTIIYSAPLSTYETRSFAPLGSTLRRSKTCLSFLIKAPASLLMAMAPSNISFKFISACSRYGQYNFSLHRMFLIMGYKFLQRTFNVFFVQLRQFSGYTSHPVLTKGLTELG